MAGRSSDNVKSLNILVVLPDELIEEIVDYLNTMDLIFKLSRIWKEWRRITFSTLHKRHQEIITKFKLSEHFSRFDYFDEFLSSNIGRKFVKYLMKQQVMKLSNKLYKISIQSNDLQTVSFEQNWVDEELKGLRTYFLEYSDTSQPQPKPILIDALANQTNENSKKGFFQSAYSVLTSLFSTPPTKTSNQTDITPATKKPPPITTTPKRIESKPQDCDYLTKVTLDGARGCGKTSFFGCSLRDTPAVPSVYVPTIGVEFAMKKFQFGTTSCVKIQLWDQCARYRSISTAYFKRSSTTLLLVDPRDKHQIENLEQCVENIKNNAPEFVDIILVTTKKDIDIDKTNSLKVGKRVMSNEQADLFAFEKFGGLHMDITSMQLEEPKIITIYCALMEYLTVPIADDQSQLSQTKNK